MYGSSLRDVEVVGLMTCARVVLGKGAKVLIKMCTAHAKLELEPRMCVSLDVINEKMWRVRCAVHTL